MIYKLLKFLIGTAIRLYYREIHIQNRAVLDEPGPKIIIANHPNTLMDAWMVGHVCKQRIYYMAKSTFFSSSIKRWFLESLGMIPINRASDSAVKGISNADSFEACYKILAEGKTLVIFPEGTSYQERHLRELKSGTARIALEAEKRNDNSLGIKVVPIGLIYLKAEKFRSSVMVNIGDGIPVEEYAREYSENGIKAAKTLTEKFRINMERLLVNSTSKEQEVLVDNIIEILSSNYVKEERKHNVEDEVEELRKVNEELNAILLAQPWKLEEIEELVFQIKWKIEQFDIRPDFLDRRYRPWMFIRQLILSLLFMILGLPIFLFGLVHNYVQYKLIDKVILALVKDVEYYAPIAVLFSLVVYPLVYLGFCFGLDHFYPLSDLEFWLYFSSMPLTGMFAYYFAAYMKHVSFKLRFVLLMEEDKSKLIELKRQREKLRKLIFS